MFDPDYSVLFNSHAWSDSEDIIDLVEAVFNDLPLSTQEDLIGKSNNKGGMSVKDILRIVIVDQYSTWRTDPHLCTGFPRRASDWQVNNRYNGQGVPRKITKVVDALIATRYLRFKMGESTNAGDPNDQRSRIQPTKKLKDLFKKLDQDQIEVQAHHKKETVILRDENNADIPYPDSAKTLRIKRVVDAYNAMMKRHHVDVASLRKPVFIREETDQKGTARKEVIPIGPDYMFTYRIFSRGDTRFNKHGRWYGGFWLRLPKKGPDLRKDIYIDGEPTDEVDFSGLHPTLLALKHGKYLKGDKYDLGYQLFDDVSLSEQRTMVKELVLIAINSKTLSDAFGAYNQANKGHTLKHKELEKLLAAFINKYPFLKADLCSDKGIDLMYIDSLITEAIIRRFVEDDKPILPIHDSYIVKQSDRLYLKQVMNEACNEVLGHTLSFESEFDEQSGYLAHATQYRLTDPDYYNSILNKRKTRVSKAYLTRYRLWLYRVR